MRGSLADAIGRLVRQLRGDEYLEEAELLEVPMLSERGPADVRDLGVDPARMAAVLEG